MLRDGQGVLNYTDDVYLFAQTALTDVLPPYAGLVLEGACEWQRVEVVDAKEEKVKEDKVMDGSGASRWSVSCLVLERSSTRSFSPFNRARYAVIEAAILATRAHLPNFGAAQRAKIDELREIVLKTGGEREIAAFDLIQSKL